MKRSTYKSLMKEMSNLISTSSGVTPPTTTTNNTPPNKTKDKEIPPLAGTIKPIQPMKGITPINTTKTESVMSGQKYYSMLDAYKNVYETKGYQEGGQVGPEKQPVVGGLKAGVVLPQQSVTKVNAEVNPQETKIGDVEQAYYTFPAGFDPTNRQDVGSKSNKVEYKAEQNNISAGDLLDFIVESGITETVEGAEAIYTHMSTDWMNSLVDGLIEEGKKGRCWTGYKPTPGKTAFSPGSCEKA